MIAHDYKSIDTSPKPCQCARVTRHAVELLQGLALAALIYTLAVLAFSL